MFTTESFYNGRIVLHGGDCREVVKTLPDNSLDSVVTDTPYALESVIKRFGDENAAPVIPGKTGAYARASRGFMGQKWDTGEVAHDPAFWRDWYRVLKPGAYIAAFGGDRTYHRLASAIEGAGFEIRHTVLNVIDPASPVVAFMQSLDAEQLGAFLRCMDDAQLGGLFAWMYGTGFPKSHDLSKGIDGHLFKLWLDADPSRRAGYREEMKATKRHRSPEKQRKAKAAVEARWRTLGGFARNVTSIGLTRSSGMTGGNYIGGDEMPETRISTRAATGEAFQWEGWGTALKPAFEPIVIARKPLSEETIAANVLRWRTGALNIGASRVGTEVRINPLGLPGANVQRLHGGDGRDANNAQKYADENRAHSGSTVEGRWPANVTHDGSDAVVDMFPDSDGQQADARSDGAPKTGNIYGAMNHRLGEASADRTYEDRGATTFTLKPGARRGDSGSASRFFYSSKANGDDRAGSKHPTVKPVSIKQWLVRLVTPPGGITADPFAGTGTTGEAAVREGVRCILIEREPKYLEDVRRRMAMVFAGPEERQRLATVPAPVDPLPLFKASNGAARARPGAVSVSPTTNEGEKMNTPAAPPAPAIPSLDTSQGTALAVDLLAKLRGKLRPMNIPTLTADVVESGDNR
jgi:site-specific DNA-methyltransferase (adenine-specific)